MAIVSAIPSPEGKLLTSYFTARGDFVAEVFPWSFQAFGSIYDLTVCVGPVRWSPPAKRRILLLLGPVADHLALDWDVVIVTSKKAAKLAQGIGNKVIIHPPPLIGLLDGRRCAAAESRVSMHASSHSEYFRVSVRMCLWGGLGGLGELFSTRRFNILARNGGFGVYSGMIDGYDVQVRRHLALGSPVVCPRDREVLGDLADSCVEREVDIKPVSPIPDAVGEQDYLAVLDADVFGKA